MTGPHWKRDPDDPTCRSGDCGDDAEFEIKVNHRTKAGRYEKAREWNGKFCGKHLQRVLPARLQMLGPSEVMTINKVRGK